MSAKFGWCLSNQHADDPSVPEYSRCPGKQWTLICPCDCHKNPLPTQWQAVHAEAPVSPTFSKTETPAPDTDDAPAPPAPKKKQRRKLL